MICMSGRLVLLINCWMLWSVNLLTFNLILCKLISFGSVSLFVSNESNMINIARIRLTPIPCNALSKNVNKFESVREIIKFQFSGDSQNARVMDARECEQCSIYSNRRSGWNQTFYANHAINESTLIAGATLLEVCWNMEIK